MNDLRDEFDFNLNRICYFYAMPPLVMRAEDISFDNFFSSYCRVMDWNGCSNFAHAVVYFSKENFDDWIKKCGKVITVRTPLNNRRIANTEYNGYQFIIHEHLALRRFTNFKK